MSWLLRWALNALALVLGWRLGRWLAFRYLESVEFRRRLAAGKIAR